ncbi:MAG: pilus assembly protein PilM [Clostridia bacterium]|nr:pilus assembly protein PilM [Clostridia bacterium]
MLLDFFSRKNATICIDIGFRNIKVTEVRKKSGNHVIVQKFGIAKTPRGCISNGSIFDAPSAINAISGIIRQNKMRAKSSKIIMSGTNIITRVCTADKIPGEDFHTTVKKHVIPYYLPTIKNDYQIDYKLLETIHQEEKEIYKIFITAVPKIVLQSYVRVLQGLNLIPVSVDIPANSAAKFFHKAASVDITRYWPKEERVSDKDLSTFAVIDFGSETTIVNIFQNKVLEFNRVILCGSSNIDEQIAKTCKLKDEDAEIQKINYGMLPPSTNSPVEHHQVNKTVHSFICKLTKQIQDCFHFFNQRDYSGSISKVFVMGGGSQLLGLDKHLESTLGIPVYPVSLLDLDGIKIDRKIEKKHLNYLVNSIGISL